MAIVVMLDDSPALRVASKSKRRDALSYDFTIVGYASLVSHAWICQLRSANGTKKVDLTVTPVLATVTTTNDSVRIVASASGTKMNVPKGVYTVELQNSTNARTWMSGTHEVLEDRAN